MNVNRYLTLLILIIFSQSISIAASSTATYRLLRFDLTTKTFAFQDTTVTWNSHSSCYSEYQSGFTFNDKDYFYFYSDCYSINFDYTDLDLESNDGNFIGGLWGVYGFNLCIWEPYYFSKSIEQPTQDGIWLLNGRHGTAFLSNKDSLYYFDDLLLHISGNLSISGDTTTYFLLTKSKEYLYEGTVHYIVDLSESPKILYMDEISIESEDPDIVIAPYKIVKLTNTKYLLALPNCVYYCEFSISKLVLRKKLLSFYDSFYNDRCWAYKNNHVYFLDSNNLIKARIDTTNSALTDSTILLSGVGSMFDVSPNNKFISAVVRDTLFVYSTETNSFYTKYDLDTIDFLRYKIISTDNNLYFTAVLKPTGVHDDNSGIPTNFSLYQNYPNPFNPSTTIKYSIPSVGRKGFSTNLVTLKVYDMLGREIQTLVNEEKQPGNYEVTFNGSGLASGVYFYRLQNGLFSETKKFVMMK